MISTQLIFASYKRDKSKFPKIESDLTDTAKPNIDSLFDEAILAKHARLQLVIDRWSLSSDFKF